MIVDDTRWWCGTVRVQRRVIVETIINYRDRLNRVWEEYLLLSGVNGARLRLTCDGALSFQDCGKNAWSQVSLRPPGERQAETSTRWARDEHRGWVFTYIGMPCHRIHSASNSPVEVLVWILGLFEFYDFQVPFPLLTHFPPFHPRFSWLHLQKP